MPRAPSLRLGTNDFTIAAWVRLPEETEQDDSYGDILSQFDPVTRRGFNFRITHNSGVTTSQPNSCNVHFGMDDGQLFASSYDEGHVFRYDGTNWVDCGQVGPLENPQTYSFAVYEGRLHVGTWNTGRVFRYGGDHHWEDIGRLGQELEVMGMMVHNGKLYAGSLPLAEVYRYDGPEHWTWLVQVDTTPDVKYRRAWTMAEFQGRLFCGTLPSGRVWSFEAGKNVTYDRALTPGWHHLAAIRQGDRLTLHLDGKLVASSAQFESTGYDLSLGQPLKIGFGPSDYFRGSLRDVRIYDYAMDERDLSKLPGEPGGK